MTTYSAGILIHRTGPKGREVLLVHPGGPFWTNKDVGAWSIPKGHVDPGEDHKLAARREFSEEVGPVPPGDLLPLGEFRQRSGKVVVAYALTGDFDPASLRSNTVEIDWPPRSGRRLTIPEVDRAAWFGMAEARVKMVAGQQPMLDVLERLLP